MLVLVDHCVLADRVVLALPFADALVVWVEPSGPGHLGMVDLIVLAPLVSVGVPGDAYAAQTLAGTGVHVAMELGRERQQR